MSFWYALSFEDVRSMPMAAVSMYMERLPARQAEWKLAMTQAAAIPHMKKENRKAAVRALEKQANEYREQEAHVASPAKLKMMGIGVRFVSD